MRLLSSLSTCARVLPFSPSFTHHRPPSSPLPPPSSQSGIRFTDSFALSFHIHCHRLLKYAVAGPALATAAAVLVAAAGVGGGGNGGAGPRPRGGSGGRRASSSGLLGL
jgi:hypothetical protein